MPQLYVGDPAPWFVGETVSTPQFNFSMAGGRYVCLLFVESTRDPAVAEALAALAARRPLFDDSKATLFVVSADPSDKDEAKHADAAGLRFFIDPERHISGLYEASLDGGPVGAQWLVLDPTLRVLALGAASTFATMLEQLEALPAPDLHAGFQVQAPVLIIPRVFEPGFCRGLVELYEKHGGTESGFMREIGGKTIAVQDPNHKRRSDYVIEEEEIRAACRVRVERRIVPEIRKVFQFGVTRMERYLVGCYDAGEGGHFRAHRDNTTKGTAHRRFAVTLNLNADDYDGGELRFPEFGQRTYKPATGGAVIFSCSLLHEATRVTRGRRYAFLPFLYDEEGAQVREANNQFLDRSLGQYKSGIPSPAEAATAES